MAKKTPEQLYGNAARLLNIAGYCLVATGIAGTVIAIAILWHVVRL